MNQYVFEHPSSLNHYTAGAFVVRCFDNRFWRVFHTFVKSLGLEHIDLESVAGGAKIFASPEKESDCDFLLRELEKSILLHHVKKVMLFTHHDCGAYGGFAHFENDRDREFAFHQKEHHKAAAAISGQFPGLFIEGYFLDEKGVVAINRKG